MSDQKRTTTRTPASARAPAAPGAEHPVTPGRETSPAAAERHDVQDFLAKLKATAPRTDAGRGRLIFAMDATMSRQPTWDMALGLQADMFRAVKEVGGLDVQLVFFRGSGECRASRWVGDPDALAGLMTKVHCAGGFTQIAKVLSHARQEAERQKVHALIYVGDASEEPVDELCGRAGELTLHGVPVFVFQEGGDPIAATAFREIARLTKGAYCRFGHGSATELRALLSAVAVFAAGGRRALEDLGRQGGRGARLLIEQMK